MFTRRLMLTLTVLILTAGLVLAEDDPAERVDVGTKAPDFRLNDQHGKALGLAEHGQEHWTIVAFYPKSATPG